MLLSRRQPRVQGQDLDVPRGALVVSRAPASSLQVIEEGRLRVADVALAGQENQDVAVALRAQLVHRVTDRGLHVDVLAHAVAERRQLVVRVLQDQLHGAGLGDVSGLDDLDRLIRLRGRGLGRVRRGRRRAEGTVADLHRVRAARHLDNRRRLDEATRAARALPRAEMARETVRINRRGRDDDLQVRARGQQARHVAQDEVDVQAALVGLVDDERVVAAQHRIRLDLRQQNAVRHQFDQGRGADLVRETHLVAHDLAGVAAHGLAQLVGDAIRDRARREPARLSVPDHAGHAAAQLHADLRQLCRLTRARLTRHDDHLMVADGARDLVAPGAHRQVREFDHRDSCGALGELLRREGLEGARVVARAAALAAALGLAILVASSPARAVRAILAGVPVAAASCGIAPAGGATRVGLGRRGARVRHDRASLVARHAGRAARGAWGSARRQVRQDAHTPKVARNFLWSVFGCGLNPHDFNGLISNIEIVVGELRATLLGICWV